MTGVNLAADLKVSLLHISELVRKYDLLSETEQKTMRHLLYKQTGVYGKKFVSDFLPSVREANAKMDAKHETS